MMFIEVYIIFGLTSTRYSEPCRRGWFGHRSRLSLVEELVEYIRGHDGVWFATHEEVARYCLAVS